MENLEQENQALREKVSSMESEMERLAALVSTLLTQSQVQPSANESSAIPSPSVVTTNPLLTRPEGCTWGMPHFSVNEELHPVVSEISPPGATQLVPTPQPGPSMPQATVTYATPVVNTVPHTVEPIYHADSVGYDRMEDLQDKYNEMQKEMRALRGKDLFGQNAQELCLVHNVVVPHKFSDVCADDVNTD
jgi:hypothetical protein